MKTTMTISNDPSWFIPDWPAPPHVRSLTTLRTGGVSQGAYASFNLGDHVGDDQLAVAANRAKVAAQVGSEPVWLRQVHGTRVIDAAEFVLSGLPPEADAAFSRHTDVVCAVMTADCLPVLLCDEVGIVVAAAHAGWRGLLDGVLEATIEAMGEPGEKLLAWFGPAIGATAFEVGDEVRSAFVAASAEAASAFKSAPQGKWLADIYALARQRLAGQGVRRIFGGTCCTVNDAARFFSYRRDGQTGRMATMIWLDR